MIRTADDERLLLTPASVAEVPKVSRRSVWLKLGVVTVDAVSVTTGMLLAFFLRNAFPVIAGPVLHGRDQLVLGALALPLWLVMFVHYRLYRTRHVQNRLQEFKRVVNAVGASVLMMAFVGTMGKLSINRGWLILCAPACICTVFGSREMVRRGFQRLRRRGHLMRQVVVVGNNLEGELLCHMLETDLSLGYEVVGFVDCNPGSPRPRRDDRPMVPHIGNVVAAVRSTGATGAVIATTSVDMETANRLARQLTDAGIHVELSSSLRDIATERLTLRLLGRYPVVYVEPVARRGWRTASKRLFDTVFATVALVVLSPVLLVAAIAIKLDSRGPVLFRQPRAGRDGKTFELIKLRTMVPNAEALKSSLVSLNEAPGPLFKIRNDPRMTAVGRRLRKFSIDELPQLWNVIRGEMSLVGPRPALLEEYEASDETHRQRGRVRPGMTGMWQVNGRSSSSFEDYVRFDLYYVDNWSFWTDLAIIAKTLPVVMFARGAS